MSAAGRSRVTVEHKADELPATAGLLLRGAERLAPESPGLRVDELSLDAALEELDLRPTGLDVLLVPPAHARASTAEVADAIVAGVRGSVGRPSP